MFICVLVCVLCVWEIEFVSSYDDWLFMRIDVRYFYKQFYDWALGSADITIYFFFISISTIEDALRNEEEDDEKRNKNE